MEHEPGYLLQIEFQRQPQVGLFRSGFQNVGNDREFYGRNHERLRVIDIGLIPQQDALDPLCDQAKMGGEHVAARLRGRRPAVKHQSGNSRLCPVLPFRPFGDHTGKS